MTVLHEGERFYFHDETQFRGRWFTVVNTYSDRYEVVDQNRNAYDMIRGESDLLISEPDGHLEVSVPQSEIVKQTKIEQ